MNTSETHLESPNSVKQAGQDSFDALHALSEPFGQSHLLRFWHELDAAQRTELASEIRELDLHHIKTVYQAASSPARRRTDSEAESAALRPIPKQICSGPGECSAAELSRYARIGLEEVRAGHVAAITLAGGQGTRLNVSHPKGMYSVALPSNKSLYQLQAERLLKLQRLAAAAATTSSNDVTSNNCIIPWYIMTSEHTKRDTQQFFEAHAYFGLDPAHVVLFEQYTFPCVDAASGRILLAEPHRLARAPDGNGGLYEALARQGILDEMTQRRGVRHVHVFGVDNILVRVADPAFIGYCVERGAEAGNKVVEKLDPDELVGIVGVLAAGGGGGGGAGGGGRYHVVEYTEISDENKRLREESDAGGVDGARGEGRLVYRHGNIVNHYFSVEFLQRVCGGSVARLLKSHVAHKRIPHIDLESGETARPAAPNGFKFEKFVFDVFQFADKFVLWLVDRKSEFSPLKNAAGAADSSPLHSKFDYLRLHRELLRNHAPTPECRAALDELDIEISPLASLGGEGLERLDWSTLQLPPSTDCVTGSDANEAAATTLRKCFRVEEKDNQNAKHQKQQNGDGVASRQLENGEDNEATHQHTLCFVQCTPSNNTINNNNNCKSTSS